LIDQLVPQQHASESKIRVKKIESSISGLAQQYISLADYSVFRCKHPIGWKIGDKITITKNTKTFPYAGPYLIFNRTQNYRISGYLNSDGNGIYEKVTFF
jgi:hypothetical protein